MSKSKREMVVLTDVSLITAIVQRGKADEVVKAAQEVGAQGASIHYSHGRGVRERLGVLGLVVEAEKETIIWMVSFSASTTNPRTPRRSRTPRPWE